MPSDYSTKKLFIGLGIVALYFIIAALPTPDGLTPVGKKAIAMMLAAVLVWVFEVIPIAVSSILFTLLPVVAGIIPLPKVMAHFATPTLFFVFAMFCISIAFQNSGLNRRVVLWTSLRSRGNPSRLLFFLMMVSALLSSFLADIPVVAMMLPVAVLLLEKNRCEPGVSPFGKAVMLGLPIACLIGGVGTPAGCSMNMLTIGLLQDTAKVHISFFEWMAIGMPMVLILTPVAWWAVIKAFPPEIDRLAGMELVEQEYAELGPVTGREKLFFVILLINFILWCTDKIHGLPLPVVAVIGGSLFVLPRIQLIEWERDKCRIGWDILMLIGAANALGMIIWEQGGASWIANACLGDISGLPLAGVIAAISIFTIVIHLLIPVNTAIVAVLLPALVALAGTMGANPAVLAIPMGFSVSAALLLPLDPVPLVTYPAGYYKMFDMFKPGCLISVVWVVVMTLVMFAIAVPLGLL
jgi:sodium-dependent dicarboxylate transporter 2/3/5